MASPEMLKWQYKVVIAELQHLQLHASDPTCPCTLGDSGEYCLPKHALMVASLATETASMDTGNGDMFRQLADEANSVHETLRGHVCGYGQDFPVVTWSRDWRKKIEGLYYACQVAPATMEQSKTTPPEKQPRWCFPVKEVERSLGRVSRELGMLQSKTKGLRERLDLPIQICRGQVEMFQEPMTDPWGSRCRDPLTGRWAPKEDCPEVPDDSWTIEGKELTWAISPIGFRRYDFVYKVYEADKLIPSHNPFTFMPSPEFPQELQPRLRERAAPQVQVEKIAAHLDPGLLLEDFHATDRGAPIIGSDMVVESGNGRAMAVILAAKNYPDVYAEYKKALLAKAPEYGLDPGPIEAMETPILVRERITDVVRTDFVAEANATSSISRSTVEIARTDAELITAEMLDQLTVLDGEAIEDALRAPRNRGVVNRFLEKLPYEEQAGLVDAAGVVNQDGIRRVGTAIFVKAFSTADTGLVLAERWFESTEPDVKNIFNGIARALGPLARAESLVAANDRHHSLSIAQDLTEAITVYSKIRKLGMRVEDYLAQMPMFERETDEFQEKILVALHDRRRSPKRVGELLRIYAELVIESPHPAQTTLIEVAEPNKEAFWDEAMRRTEREPEPVPAMFQNLCLFQRPGRTAHKVTFPAARREVTFAPETVSEMVRFSDETKTRERGFELCEDSEGMLRPGRRCTGGQCSIRIKDCGPDKARGFFHTHPGREEFLQRTFSCGDLMAVAQTGKLACVGGSVADAITCATQKPGTTVGAVRRGAYPYIHPSTPDRERQWIKEGRGKWYFPSVGEKFDYVEIPKRELPPPPIRPTGEQLKLFRNKQRKERDETDKAAKESDQEKEGEKEKNELSSGELLAEIASKICGDGSCFAKAPDTNRTCKLVGDYYHCKVKPKGHFDPRSFRTVTPKEGVRVTIGCKKNKWDPKAKRCRIGTEAQKVMYHRDIYEGGS